MDYATKSSSNRELFETTLKAVKAEPAVAKCLAFASQRMQDTYKINATPVFEQSNATHLEGELFAYVAARVRDAYGTYGLETSHSPAESLRSDVVKTFTKFSPVPEDLMEKVDQIIDAKFAQKPQEIKQPGETAVISKVAKVQTRPMQL